MFKNYLVTAWRNIKRYKVYSSINIIGLTIGLTVFLVLSLFVIDDLTFDCFHKNADYIYRMITENYKGDQKTATWAITVGPLVPALKNEIPEVEASVRLYDGRFNIPRTDILQEINETGNSVQVYAIVTEPDFFDIFSFRILSGNASVLSTPNGVLITPKLANALFGNQDPMGKSLVIPRMENPYVAGIVESPPKNSHIQFDILMPLHVEQNPLWNDSWENFALSGYVRLNKTADVSAVGTKMVQIARSNNFPENDVPVLQPLKKVHLGSSGFTYDFRNLGKIDATVVLVLGIIGILVLVIASINFVNLSSARAVKRAREVGLRKVVGSNRWQLVKQFLSESMVMTSTAMLMALIIIQLLLPRLTTFLGKELEMNFLTDPSLIPAVIGITLIIGFLSGLYPSCILSGFIPMEVLKGHFHSGRKGVLLRRILVIFQFVISIALILCILTASRQISFLKKMDMGYNREQILVVTTPLRGEDDIMKQRLKTIPSVLSVGRMSNLPGDVVLRTDVIPEGLDETSSLVFQSYSIDDNLINTLDISVSKGNQFSKERLAETQNMVMINETAARILNWEDPINRRLGIIELDGSIRTSRVMGIVKDFHYNNIHANMEPLMIDYNPQRMRFLMIRITGDKINETIRQIENLHKELYPNRPFVYRFLDDVFDQQFNQDRRFATHIGFFSGISIFIACLGLIGLVSFAVEQRRREIAVRKVLGSNERRIVMILTSDILKWVVLSNFIAWPLGYLAINKWLNSFAYRMPLEISPFIVASLTALFIAMITISFQTIRASRRNPAIVLRQE